MNEKKKIVIFDFCETLANFQTADAFVDYVRETLNINCVNRRNRIGVSLRNTGIVDYFDFFTRNRFSLSKRLKLLQIRGLDSVLLQGLAEEYYHVRIKTNLIPETLGLLKKYQMEGCEIWVVSGGYGIYLKFFVDEFKIDKLLSSNIQLRNGIATGRMEGPDCMNKNKVKLLQVELSRQSDFRIVASFSDSKSDVPILSIAEKAYVISKVHQVWVDSYHFNEITRGGE